LENETIYQTESQTARVTGDGASTGIEGTIYPSITAGKMSYEACFSCYCANSIAALPRSFIPSSLRRTLTKARPTAS
jgi:hypothetical protein